MEEKDSAIGSASAKLTRQVFLDWIVIFGKPYISDGGDDRYQARKADSYRISDPDDV